MTNGIDVYRVMNYIRQNSTEDGKILNDALDFFILPGSASTMLTALSTGSYWGNNDNDVFKSQILELFREKVLREEYSLKIMNDRKELKQRSECFVKRFIENLEVGIKSIFKRNGSLLYFLDDIKNPEYLSFDAFKRRIINVSESPLEDFLPTSLGLLVESYIGPVRSVPLVVAIAFVLANYLIDCKRGLYEEHDFSIINLLKQKGIYFSLNGLFYQLNQFIATTDYRKFLRNNTSDNRYLLCFLNEIIVQSKETQWLGGQRCEDINGSTMVSLGHVVSFFESIENIDSLIVFIFITN
jgi:hypothetical protein